MFDRAVEIVLETRRGSVSLLQRRLAIGYTRSSRLIDLMGIAGIISEHKGSVARDVLITPEDWERMKVLADEEATRTGQSPVFGSGSDSLFPENDDEAATASTSTEEPPFRTDEDEVEEDALDAEELDEEEVDEEDEDGEWEEAAEGDEEEEEDEDDAEYEASDDEEEEEEDEEYEYVDEEGEEDEEEDEDAEVEDEAEDEWEEDDEDEDTDPTDSGQPDRLYGAA